MRVRQLTEIGTIAGVLLLTGCAEKTLTIPESLILPELAREDLTPLSVKTLPPPPLPQVVVSLPLSMEPPPAPVTPKKKRAQGEDPRKLVDQAKREATVKPTHAGYGYGTRIAQIYPWWPGRLFEVYTSPAQPSVIKLPPGQLLAKHFQPMFDKTLWAVGVVPQGEGPRAFHSIVIRPDSAGLDMTMPLLLQEGTILYVRVRSFLDTSMVEVTWEEPPRSEKR